jgi:hypothetical protein
VTDDVRRRGWVSEQRLKRREVLPEVEWLPDRPWPGRSIPEEIRREHVVGRREHVGELSPLPR